MINSLSAKYSIIKELGSGEFRRIFIGKNNNTGKMVAIKIGKDMESILLNNEAKVYNVLAEEKGFPKMRGYGKRKWL